jgi:hypothetical protein
MTTTGPRRRPAPPEPPGPPGPPEHRDGQTTPVKDAVRAHSQPHERDESSASQQRPPDELMQQAHDDVERGVVDTSRGDATEETYRRHLRSGPQEAAPVAPKPPGKQKPGKPR